MTEGEVGVEIAAGVGRVILRRPPFNVISTAMAREITRALARLDADPAVKVICLRGDGERAFAAGSDVSEHQREQLVEHCDAIFAMVEALVDPRGKPRVAAIQGYCSGGGCETAFACDVVVACDDTRLALPEIKIGVLSSLAANLMARIAPAGRIFEMAMTGEWIDAKAAYDIGLVAKVWSRADFEAELAAYLQLYASKSGEALSLGRKLLREALSRPLLTSLASLNHDILEEATVIDDYAEGVAAFLEKRPPVWTS